MSITTLLRETLFVIGWWALEASAEKFWREKEGSKPLRPEDSIPDLFKYRPPEEKEFYEKFVAELEKG